MDSGRCPSCSRSYTVGEVAGLGILRTRPAAEGGPVVEFQCPACDRVIRLIPYGEGRYAVPGEPPPPAVPPEARTPPWARRRRPSRPSADPPEPERIEIPVPEPPPETPPPRSREALPSEDREDVTPAEALAILGVEPTADRATVERAFRERSRTCHPDKVAHLDEEFQALAEEKFRRLKRALEVLTE